MTREPYDKIKGHALAQYNAEPKQKVLKQVLASLVAAVSLLKSRVKKAAPSDKMFNQMILDYEKAIEQGRAALAQSNAEPNKESSVKQTDLEALKIVCDLAADYPNVIGYLTKQEKEAIKRVKRLRAALAQSDDDNFERHQNARISKLEREIAELTSDANMDPVAWKLVPKEPTTEMIVAAFDEVELRPNASPQFPNIEARRLIYKAMVVAAPVPPCPDASAGLIEAAVLCRTHVAYYEGGKPVRLVPSGGGEPYGHLFADAIEALRARATDRSGK